MALYRGRRGCQVMIMVRGTSHRHRSLCNKKWYFLLSYLLVIIREGCKIRWVPRPGLRRGDRHFFWFLRTGIDTFFGFWKRGACNFLCFFEKVGMDLSSLFRKKGQGLFGTQKLPKVQMSFKIQGRSDLFWIWKGGIAFFDFWKRGARTFLELEKGDKHRFWKGGDGTFYGTEKSQNPDLSTP